MRKERRFEMWMDAYVQEILLRDHIAEAQRWAAMNTRLRGETPAPPRSGIRRLVAWLRS